MILTDLQQYGLELLENNDNILINWGRRNGQTTVMLYHIVDYCLKNYNSHVLILFCGSPGFDHINKTITSVYNSLNYDAISFRSVNYIHFKNGSKIIINTSSNYLIYRGYDLDTLYVCDHNLTSYSIMLYSQQFNKILIDTTKNKYDYLNKSFTSFYISDDSDSIWRTLKIKKLKQRMSS